MFGVVIERAAKAGESALVVGAFDRMCEAGVSPTPEIFAVLTDQLAGQQGPQGGQRSTEDVSAQWCLLPLTKGARAWASEGRHTLRVGCPTRRHPG